MEVIPSGLVSKTMRNHYTVRCNFQQFDSCLEKSIIYHKSGNHQGKSCGESGLLLTTHLGHCWCLVTYQWHNIADYACWWHIAFVLENWYTGEKKITFLAEIYKFGCVHWDIGRYRDVIVQQPFVSGGSVCSAPV